MARVATGAHAALHVAFNPFHFYPLKTVEEVKISAKCLQWVLKRLAASRGVGKDCQSFRNKGGVVESDRSLVFVLVEFGGSTVVPACHLPMIQRSLNPASEIASHGYVRCKLLHVQQSIKAAKVTVTETVLGTQFAAKLLSKVKQWPVDW